MQGLQEAEYSPVVCGARLCPFLGCGGNFERTHGRIFPQDNFMDVHPLHFLKLPYLYVQFVVFPAYFDWSADQVCR